MSNILLHTTKFHVHFWLTKLGSRSPTQLWEHMQLCKVNYRAHLQFKIKILCNPFLLQWQLNYCYALRRKIKAARKVKRANRGSKRDTRECICHKGLGMWRRWRCVRVQHKLLHVSLCTCRKLTKLDLHVCMCAGVHISMCILAHVCVCVSIIKSFAQTMKPDWRPQSNSST